LRNESDNIFGKKIEHISARHGPQSARWRAGGLEGFKQPIGTATPGLRPSSSPPSRKRKKIIKDKAREERKASGGDSFEAADKVEAVSVCGKPAGRSLVAARGGGLGKAAAVVLLGPLGFRAAGRPARRRQGRAFPLSVPL
jgi:hypothetical protein